MDWLAHYHYIFVHFPIALIIMACMVELIRTYRQEAAHESIPNFLLISALLFLIPTIGTGLLLEDSGVVSPANQETVEWHESLAFATFILTIATILLRRWVGRGLVYFLSLALLAFSVSLTAHFGGLMAFGPLRFLPSF